MRLGVEAWGLSGDLYYTGMGQYAARLLRLLPSLAPDIEIVAYAAPAEKRPAWLPGAVVWRPVGVRLPAKLTALASRLIALPSYLRADRIDLLHVPAVHMRPFFPPVASAPCPVAVTLHDLIPMTYYDIRTLPARQRLFYRWNLRRAASADAMLTVSNWSRDEIARGLGLAAERIRVIHNGVDFAPNADDSVLRRLGIKDDYVLYAGSYEPRKNLAGALAVFAKLVRSGDPRTLVAVVERASGHAGAALGAHAGLGLGKRVRFVHSLAESDLRALYTHADALLFPSFAEGFGLPPIQAAACGVPVVASDLPVLREILGDAALFAQPGDHDALAEALRRLASDAALRESLRDRGRKRALRFGEEDMARRHAQFFRELAPT